MATLMYVGLMAWIIVGLGWCVAWWWDEAYGPR